MATSMVNPSRNVSSSVTLLDNVSHYGAFFFRSPHSLKIGRHPSRSRTTDIFRRGVEGGPDFHQDASDVKRTVGERAEGAASLVLPVISPRAVPLATMPTSIMSRRRLPDQPSAG